MPNTKDTLYEAEWMEDDEDKKSPEQVQDEARKLLAEAALGFVNESIRDRNASTFSEDIKRAYRLYNATGQDIMNDIMEGFEGSRTAAKDGSKVIQNIIRQMTNDGSSQLGDMLYPTDTKNYGVLPIYPARPPLAVKDQPAVTASGEPMLDGEGNPVTHQMAWKARKAAVDYKTERMSEKIEENLKRVKFGQLGRKALDNAAITGTAIIKGPFLDDTTIGWWAQAGEGKWSLQKDSAARASFKVISALDFLPDMAAEDKDTLGYASCREWYAPRKLRRLLKSSYYYDDAIARVLSSKPRGGYSGSGAPEGEHERQSIKDAALVEELYKRNYELFETWAEFDVALLREAGVKAVPENIPDGGTVLACVIHCQGEALKIYVNPMPKDDLPFSIWTWDDDPTSIFGKGIPILAENCQLIYNAVWRMILDHGGLGAVPMISIIKDKVKSAVKGEENDYSLRGGKVWEILSDAFTLPDGSKTQPFNIHDIPIKLDQFFAIMDKAEEDAYKLTGVTRIDKNNAGVDNAPITLGATQIFQNNSSVSRRRQVRKFDDDITKDTLTRLYDFLMRFEPDDDFKVPIEIEPRGSSVLMQRELNTQNVMNLYTITGNGTTPGTKGEAMLRAIQSGMQFPEGKFIETETETLERQTLEAENPPVDPEVLIKREELAHKVRVEEANIEVAFYEQQSKDEERKAMVELKAINDERIHYREMTKMELMTNIDAEKHFSALEAKREEVMNKLQASLQDINARRDIAASQMLTKEITTAGTVAAQNKVADAKLIEAKTKEGELVNKINGTIESGI